MPCCVPLRVEVALVHRVEVGVGVVEAEELEQLPEQLLLNLDRHPLHRDQQLLNTQPDPLTNSQPAASVVFSSICTVILFTEISSS